MATIQSEKILVVKCIITVILSPAATFPFVVTLSDWGRRRKSTNAVEGRTDCDSEWRGACRRIVQ